MIRDLQRRLEKVESALHCRDGDASSMSGMLWFAVAYYLGNPSAGEKPFAAYARALGYAHESELHKATSNNDRELSKRFNAAEKQLYEKFGVELTEDLDPKKFGDALKRMKAGLPKSYQNRLKMILARTDINLDWMLMYGEDHGLYISWFA